MKEKDFMESQKVFTDLKKFFWGSVLVEWIFFCQKDFYKNFHFLEREENISRTFFNQISAFENKIFLTYEIWKGSFFSDKEKMNFSHS